MSEKRFLILAVGLLPLMLCVSGAGAAEAVTGTPAEEAVAKAPRGDLATGLIALSSALAVGLCAIATGIAQSRIGAAGCGSIAEKPETAGTVILLVAIPETMVILGFVIGVVVLFTL